MLLWWYNYISVFQVLWAAKMPYISKKRSFCFTKQWKKTRKIFSSQVLISLNTYNMWMCELLLFYLKAKKKKKNDRERLRKKSCRKYILSIAWNIYRKYIGRMGYCVTYRILQAYIGSYTNWISNEYKCKSFYKIVCRVIASSSSSRIRCNTDDDGGITSHEREN